LKDSKDKGILDMSIQKLPLSVIVLTYNEEANIEACLQSVCGWADEVFVVDSGSTDATLDIARRYTDRIVEHPFENYARQRNWAQESLPLAHAWVFHIDADERATPELVASLRQFFASPEPETIAGLLISRRSVFFGRAIMHGGHYPAYHLRVFRRDMCRCEDRLYDQHFVTSGTTRKIHGDLIDIMTSDLAVWTTRHARWGVLEAREQLAAYPSPGTQQVIARAHGTPIERRRWLRTSVYGRAPLFVRAFGYFFYRYIVRLGFLDGMEGLIFHFLHGCWYRFYIDAQVYEMRKHQTASNQQPLRVEPARRD
jgi:glycosyltransferase involved in cell wall biosynthesis